MEKSLAQNSYHLLQNTVDSFSPFTLTQADQIQIQLIKGNTQKAIQLIKKEKNPKNLQKGSDSPLIISCILGIYDVCDALISKNIDINETSKLYKNTPLMLACHFGHENIVKLLLDNKADPNAIDIQKNTPLMFSMYGDKFSRSYYNQYNLQVAQSSLKNRLNICQLLINYGAKIQSKNKHGNTPLIISVNYQQLELSEFLLKKGSFVDQHCNQGYTSLFHACQFSNIKMVQLLIKYNANVNHESKIGQTPLFSLCDSSSSNFQEQRDICKILINKGTNINKLIKHQQKQEIIGTTPLSTAILNSQYQNDIYKYLISIGANINIVDVYGQTPLFFACQTIGKDCAVEELLNLGTDSNHQDKKKITPLMIAAESYKYNACKLLFEKKANPNIQDVNGNTALHYFWFATEGNDVLYGQIIALFELFINNNANLNILNKDKVSPIQYLVESLTNEDVDGYGNQQVLVNLLLTIISKTNLIKK